MYYEHFGLSEPPFKITPNTDFFFGGGNRGPILEALIYAVTQGEGIIKVTGEVGSGKTMLCNMLQTKLPQQVETVYLANPSVSPDEILHAIAFELQIDVVRGAGRLEVMHAIQDHLLKRYAEGRRVVLFVEESQGMPIATLEEIRLLSNLETKSDKLLQIVIFGQPELDDNLRQPQIRQLKERITHSFRLEPLNLAETREYLMFRMRAAGYRGPDLFSEAIVKEMARVSGGLTRRINIVADKALLAAFADNTHTLRQKHIDAAVRDSEFARTAAPAAPAGNTRQGFGLWLVAGGMVAGAALYAVVGNLWQPVTSTPPIAASTPSAEKNTVKSIDYGDTGAPAPAPAPETTPALPAQTPPQSAAAITPEAAASTTPPVAAPAIVVAQAPAPATETAPRVIENTAAAETGTGPALLQERLNATTAWLTSSPPGTYTVQLLGAWNDQQLNQHLRYLSKIVEINNVFVYRTLAKGEPALTLAWGNFNNRNEAREALAKLPASLKANRPLLRTVQGIQTEIAGSKTQSNKP